MSDDVRTVRISMRRAGKDLEQWQALERQLNDAIAANLRLTEENARLRTQPMAKELSRLSEGWDSLVAENEKLRRVESELRAIVHSSTFRVALPGYCDRAEAALADLDHK